MGIELVTGDAVALRRNSGWFKPGQHWRKPKPHWQRDWLHREYVEHGRAAEDIAAQMECRGTNILYWLRRHGIKPRTIAEVRAAKHWGANGPANPMYGRTGALNPRYVDGSSPERQRLYVQAAGREFLRAILKRDNYRCQRCGDIQRKRKWLHVHHIKPWAGHPELRFAPDNAATLCRSCHCFVHSNRNVDQEYLP